MPSGLVALLDDVSAIARIAAASLDDIGPAAAKAGSKAAGVVIDDAAVTPGYVTQFTPERELPIIWRITLGSLRNKLLILLPAALLLSEFLPWLITPLLMIGGLYLAFEGAEKVLELFGDTKHGETVGDAITDMAEFERARVSGAIRTDFILSAEIMAIALNEVASEPLVSRALILAVVAVAITAVVYGAVALIVKMDDIGLHLTRRGGAGSQRLGALLLRTMPVLLKLLSSVGTVAMLWVGGGILLHGAHELGWHGPSDVAHGIEHWVHDATGPLGAVLGWFSYAVVSAIAGMVAGAAVAWIVHAVQKARGRGAH